MNSNTKTLVTTALSNPTIVRELRKDQKLVKELNAISAKAKRTSVLASPGLIAAILGIAYSKYKDKQARDSLKNWHQRYFSGRVEALNKILGKIR